MSSEQYLHRRLVSVFVLSLALISVAIFSLESCSKGITDSQLKPQDSTSTQDTVKKDTLVTIPPNLEITIEPKYYTSMALSPDGTLLALGDALDRVIRIWNTSNGNLVTTIPLASTYPSTLHFSKDNSKILCADGMAAGPLSILYDIQSQKKICSMMSLQSFICDDGSIVGDGFDTVYPFPVRIRTYSPTDGSFLENITPPGLIRPQIFGTASSTYLYSPDGMSAVSPQIKVWNIASNSAQQTIAIDGIAETGVLSDNGTIFGVAKNDSTISLYSVSSGQKFSEVHPQMSLRAEGDSSQVLHDQLHAIVLSENLVASIPGNKSSTEIRLFNNTDGKLRGIYKSTEKYFGMYYQYKAITISRDERLLVGWTGTTENKIHIWHLK